MNPYIFFVLPLFLTGLVHHFLIIKGNLLGFLAIPIDFRVNLKGKRLLGDKKTLRGFIVVMVLNGLFTMLLFDLGLVETPLQFSPFISGVLIGFAYSLAEIPNSFVKRRLNIPPSEKGSGFLGTVFNLVDQVDSVTGAIIMANLITNITLSQSVLLFLIGASLHAGVDYVLYRVSYKKGLLKSKNY